MAGLGGRELAWITARVGLARVGASRMGAAPKLYEMKDDATGQIIWNRDRTNSGDPDDTNENWTNVRE